VHITEYNIVNTNYKINVFWFKLYYFKRYQDILKKINGHETKGVQKKKKKKLLAIRIPMKE